MPEETLVGITRSVKHSHAYHSDLECPAYRGERTISLDEARRRGLRECERCQADGKLGGRPDLSAYRAAVAGGGE